MLLYRSAHFLLMKALPFSYKQLSLKPYHCEYENVYVFSGRCITRGVERECHRGGGFAAGRRSEGGGPKRSLMYG